MPLTGEVAAVFQRQAANSAGLGSPFMADLCTRLVRLIDAETPLGQCLQGWRGDAEAAKLALRLGAGLHALVRGGAVPDLAAHYPPHAPGQGYDAALARVLATEHAALMEFVNTPPQTNEVARSGILIGGLLTIAQETGLPLELWEIGASAGVNLLADSWGYEFGQGRRWGPANAPVVVACDWRGAATPPLAARLHVMARRGADIAPVDAADPAQRARLLAYVWADQPDRLRRTEAALNNTARQAAQDDTLGGRLVERADAADWVANRLARPPEPGVARVLMHSIMWQYLTLPTAERISRALAEAGRRATPMTPLAWLRMERDGAEGDAAIQLTLWPGGETRLLGRGDFHGRWAAWLT